jgi:hypothetical protein
LSHAGDAGVAGKRLGVVADMYHHRADLAQAQPVADLGQDVTHVFADVDMDDADAVRVLAHACGGIEKPREVRGGERVGHDDSYLHASPAPGCDSIVSLRASRRRRNGRQAESSAVSLRDQRILVSPFVVFDRRVTAPRNEIGGRRFAPRPSGNRNIHNDICAVADFHRNVLAPVVNPRPAEAGT